MTVNDVCVCSPTSFDGRIKLKEEHELLVDALQVGELVECEAEYVLEALLFHGWALDDLTDRGDLSVCVRHELDLQAFDLGAQLGGVRRRADVAYEESVLVYILVRF